MPDPDQLDAYLAQVVAAGITTVVIAWQDEWDLTDERGFGPVQRTRLLAYRGGEILALELRNALADRRALAKRLIDAGLKVEQRSRNIA
ncbi:MAG: hypothetical protein AAB263_05535 [Planctomycetota bacterium]